MEDRARAFMRGWHRDDADLHAQLWYRGVPLAEVAELKLMGPALLRATQDGPPR